MKLNLKILLIGVLIVLTGCSQRKPTGMENCSPPTAASLPIMVSAQELENWCWAASGQMVMKTMGEDVSQCSQANDRFHLANCCPSQSAADGCDQGGWPEFEKHHILF